MLIKSVLCVFFAFVLSVLPTALARKCYICDSRTHFQCNDANQLSQSQLYSDCSQQQQFGSGMMNPQGGNFPVGPGGQPGVQPNPQFGSGPAYGYGGSDRCYKITTVGQSPNGQPMVQRGCGNPQQMGLGMVGSDGCSWNGFVQTCVCDGNYCNGSQRLPASFFLTTFLTVIAASLLKSVL